MINDLNPRPLKMAKKSSDLNQNQFHFQFETLKNKQNKNDQSK